MCDDSMATCTLVGCTRDESCPSNEIHLRPSLASLPLLCDHSMIPSKSEGGGRERERHTHN